MTFWDRFVLWAYYGFGDSLPVGRDVAARLFAEAFQRGRLVPANLNDLSILLLLALCPTGSPLRPAVEQAALGRGLHQQPSRVWQLLRASAPPRLTELLEIGRAPGQAMPALRTLVTSVVNLRSWNCLTVPHCGEGVVAGSSKLAGGPQVRLVQHDTPLPCQVNGHALE